MQQFLLLKAIPKSTFSQVCCYSTVKILCHTCVFFHDYVLLLSVCACMFSCVCVHTCLKLCVSVCVCVCVCVCVSAGYQTWSDGISVLTQIFEKCNKRKNKYANCPSTPNYILRNYASSSSQQWPLPLLSSWNSVYWRNNLMSGYKCANALILVYKCITSSQLWMHLNPAKHQDQSGCPKEILTAW